MLATSILCIDIIASNARLASSPPATSASVKTRGVICHERPHRSLHHPQALSSPPLPTMADPERSAKTLDRMYAIVKRLDAEGS